MRVNKNKKGSDAGGAKKAGKEKKPTKVTKLDDSEEAQRRERERREREKMKEKLQAEEKNSLLNNLKIQQSWRRQMRLTKVEALRKDIEVLSQNHEREVDRKDAIIQMLDRDLDEAEEQYQMALRAHLKEQDFLLEIQRSRVTSLESTFDAELAALEQEFNTERQLILHKHQAEKRELQELMEAMAKDFDEQEQVREMPFCPAAGGRRVCYRERLGAAEQGRVTLSHARARRQWQQQRAYLPDTPLLSPQDTKHEFEGHCEEIKSKSNEELNVLKMQLMQIMQISQRN